MQMPAALAANNPFMARAQRLLRNPGRCLRVAADCGQTQQVLRFMQGGAFVVAARLQAVRQQPEAVSGGLCCCGAGESHRWP